MVTKYQIRPIGRRYDCSCRRVDEENAITYGNDLMRAVKVGVHNECRLYASPSLT
jgi:hypothetical protein